MAAITDMVSIETHGHIAVLSVDNPPVNALSRGVREGLEQGVAQAIANSEIEAIVLHCKGRTFIAGADIREFGAPQVGPSLLKVIADIEAAPKPVVAAIHGTALGGGLETALSCHYRVAVPSAKFGLPEVRLGILPGAGGTQRLPRVVGVPKALAMIVGGDPIDIDEARRSELVDHVVESDLLEGRDRLRAASRGRSQTAQEGARARRQTRGSARKT